MYERKPKGNRTCVQELKERHRQVMQNMLMDMLRALATPNMDIRKKTLDIALDLINQHNIDEVTPQHPGKSRSLNVRCSGCPSSPTQVPVIV